MIKKVYVVTSGEYSDYSIEAVFVDKEVAELYKQLNFVDTDNCRVEEYPVVESMDPDPGMNAYLVVNRLPTAPAEGMSFDCVPVSRLVDGKVKTYCRYRTWKDSDPTCITHQERLLSATKFSWRGYAHTEEEAITNAAKILDAIQRGERPEGVVMGKNY